MFFLRLSLLMPGNCSFNLFFHCNLFILFYIFYPLFILFPAPFFLLPFYFYFLWFSKEITLPVWLFSYVTFMDIKRYFSKWSYFLFLSEGHTALFRSEAIAKVFCIWWYLFIKLNYFIRRQCIRINFYSGMRLKFKAGKLC